MSWSQHLKQAKVHLKSSKLNDALKELEKALLVGGDREYTVYDSRAAIYERQGKHKDALQDVKRVIKLAPTHWQGYARAARLFLEVRKLEQAVTMADMALCRLDPSDSTRRIKIDELKTKAEECRRQQVYHFGKLPVELIADIFEMVVASDWRRVLTIWRVSKYWHSVALNIPTLWSTLILTNRHPARQAQRWIERSKGRIREISFRTSLGRVPVKLDGLKWSHLRVCKLENHDIFSYIGGEWNLHKLAGLEDLQIVHETFDCDRLLSLPVRRLALDGPRFSWTLLPSNLTSLEVRNPHSSPSLEELRAVLEANSLLKLLSLDFDTSVIHPFPPLEPLTLPNLHTLQLSNVPWAAHFFKLVSMPSLETLRMARLSVYDLHDLAPVHRPCRITTLSIDTCTVHASEVLEFLQSLDSLHTLELVRLNGVANAVMELLEPRSDVCPALIHLNLSRCPDVRTSPIMALLRSRNSLPELSTETIPARIRTLKLDGCPQVEASVIPWLKAQVDTFSCIYLTKREASWKR